MRLSAWSASHCCTSGYKTSHRLRKDSPPIYKPVGPRGLVTTKLSVNLGQNESKSLGVRVGNASHEGVGPLGLWT